MINIVNKIFYLNKNYNKNLIKVNFVCPTELLYLQKSKNKLYGMSMMMMMITRGIKIIKKIFNFRKKHENASLGTTEHRSVYRFEPKCFCSGSSKS